MLVSSGSGAYLPATMQRPEITRSDLIGWVGSGAALLSVRHPRLMSVPYAEQGRVHRDVEDLTAVLGERYGHVILLCHDYQDLA